MGVIYKITSPSGKVYVGKTKRLKIRIWEYRWRSKKRKSIIHDSIKASGWEAHTFEIIEEVSDKLLNEREIFWIKELNTFWKDNKNGMNLTRGGDGNVGSWMHDTERRKKQSERFKGSGGTFYGKHHTEASKKIIAEKAKERNLKSGWTIPEWGAEKGRNIVRRKVICFDFFGKLISEHESVTSAGKDLGLNPSSISAVCKGRRHHTGGFCFEYKDVFEKQQLAKAG